MQNWFLVISFWFLDKKISFKFTIFSLMYFMLLPRIWCRGADSSAPGYLVFFQRVQCLPVRVRTQTGIEPLP